MYHGTPRPPLACSQGPSDSAPHVSATISLKQHRPSFLLVHNRSWKFSRHHRSMPNGSTEDRDVCVLGFPPTLGCIASCNVSHPPVHICTHDFLDDGATYSISRPLTHVRGRRAAAALCPSLEAPPPNLRSVIKITNCWP